MDAGAGAGRARPARHEADAGPAGQLAIGIGHHRCATFLAAEVIGDLRRVVEGVEHGEVALTGHAEDAVDAFGDELIDQDARSEEHTSELQSLMRISYAVFCLKNKTHTNSDKYI